MSIEQVDDGPGDDVDVAIVGGGLAGCVAAASLLRCGLRVRVVDRLKDPLDEFRAEQIVGLQPDRLRQVGLLSFLARDAHATRVTANYRHGAFLDCSVVEQYGLPYRAMVRAVRAALPPECLTFSRVTRIETSPARQTVHLADGRAVTACLVVLATGLMQHLAHELGIAWTMKSEAHSLCLGFGLALDEPAKQALIPLTYYRENVVDRLDYLALFGMCGAIRANLFCYNGREDPWTRRFIDRPDETLHASLPGLRKVIGSTRIVGPIDMRRNDIKIATGVERDGVVLIGDAFQTPCPAAGHGIDRILSDVETLVRLLPTWLETDGMDAAKIAQFYADNTKRAFDAECLRAARYRRDVSTKDSLRWRLHRFRVDLQRQLKRRLRNDRALLRAQDRSNLDVFDERIA